MKRTGTAAALLLLVPACAAALRAAEEHPLRQARVGDTAVYEFTNSALPGEGPRRRRTVKARDRNSVTIAVVNEVLGTKAPAPDETVSLDQPFDRLATLGGKREQTGEGEESLKVAGRELKCRWTDWKVIQESQGVRETLLVRLWVSPEVPLGGLVRMEVRPPPGQKGLELRVELREFASAPPTEK